MSMEDSSADAAAPDTAALRILVVDDDPLVRAGLRILLAGDREIAVVAEASDGDEVQQILDDDRPDVILMDIRMPRLDGIETVRRLHQNALSPPPVIMLTTFDADATVLDALRAGASGFLLKHAPPESIIAAIHQASQGEAAFSPSVLRTLVTYARTGDETAPKERPVSSAGEEAISRLTDRERDIAKLVAEGRSNTEIAARLFVSTGTVKADISTMLTRLGLTNRTQLAIVAYEHLG